MAKSITGVRELDRRLRRLDDKVARRLASAAVRSGLRLLVKEIKSGLPTELKEAKTAVGWRFKKSTTRDGKDAKVGFGVGKRSSEAKRSGRNSGGIGITKQNVHWFVLGTPSRTQETTGRSTGRMPGILENVVPRSVLSGSAGAVRKMQQNLRKGIEREARKR